MMSVAFLWSHGYQESFVYTMGEESLYQTDSGMHKHRQQEEPVHRAQSHPLTVIGKESEIGGWFFLLFFWFFGFFAKGKLT